MSFRPQKTGKNMMNPNNSRPMNFRSFPPPPPSSYYGMNRTGANMMMMERQPYPPSSFTSYSTPNMQSRANLYPRPSSSFSANMRTGMERNGMQDLMDLRNQYPGPSSYDPSMMMMQNDPPYYRTGSNVASYFIPHSFVGSDPSSMSVRAMKGLEACAAVGASAGAAALGYDLGVSALNGR